MTRSRKALLLLFCAAAATAGLVVVDRLLDRDRDDFWALGAAATDCDDANPAIFPGAPETPFPFYNFIPLKNLGFLDTSKAG